MASGIDGSSGGNIIKALDLASTSPALYKKSGSFKGKTVSMEDLSSIKGLKKSAAADAADAADGKVSAKPKEKAITLRKVRKAKPGVVATIKSKMINIGRGAVKEIVHKLSMAKRFVFNESFSKIDSGSFGKCSTDTQKELGSIRESYNEKCNALQKLKEEMVGLKDRGELFRDEHSDSLNVLDMPSIVDTVKTSMILTIPGEKNNIEISAPRSGNLEIRHKQLEQFSSEFNDSAGFKDYNNDQDRIKDIQDERSDLKLEMKELKKAMLEEFKGDLNVRYSDMNGSADRSTRTSNLMPSNENEKLDKTSKSKDEYAYGLMNLHHGVESLQGEINSLAKSILILRQDIVEATNKEGRGMENNIQKLFQQITDGEQSLKYALVQKHEKQTELAVFIEKHGNIDNEISEMEKQPGEVEGVSGLTEKEEAALIKKEKDKEISEFKKLISYERF